MWKVANGKISVLLFTGGTVKYKILSFNETL